MQILGSGLVVGYIDYMVDDSKPDGIVLKTYPSFERGEIVRLGDKIDLWLSGNKPVTDTLSFDGVDEN